MRFARNLAALAATAAGACAAPPPTSAEETAAATTAFRFVKNQILVEVMIGEEGPFTFIVDTGVTPSVIDIDVARSLGFPIDEDNSGSAAGAGSNDVRIFPTTMAGLVLAGEGLGDLPAVAAPIAAGLGGKLGEPLHGILGFAFLDSRAVRVDYVAHELSFAASPAPFEAEIEAADFRMPLRFGEGDIMPIVDVVIGDKSFVASIDTGSSLGLEVFSDAVERLGLADTVSDWERGEIAGARGSAEILNGVLPGAAIGPLTFADVPASVGPRRGGAYRDGNIGNEMWAGYTLIFDYVEGRVAFIKQA